MDLLEVDMRKERMRRARKTRWPIFFNAIMVLGLSFTVLCLVKVLKGMKQKARQEQREWIERCLWRRWGKLLWCTDQCVKEVIRGLGTLGGIWVMTLPLAFGKRKRKEEKKKWYSIMRREHWSDMCCWLRRKS